VIKRTTNDSVLNPDHQHGPLAIALRRTAAAAEVVAELAKAGPQDNDTRAAQLKQQLMTQQIGTFGRWFCRMQMYFLMVDVLAKTWEHRGEFHDADVDALIANSRVTTMLAAFRNDLTHGGPLLREDVSHFFDNLEEIDTWAQKLRDSCERYVVAYFATPRKS